MLERFYDVLDLKGPNRQRDNATKKFKKMFKEWDVDDDKEVTLAEFRKYFRERSEVRDSCSNLCTASPLACLFAGRCQWQSCRRELHGVGRALLDITLQ